MIPLQFALRRRMMMAGGGGAPISELPLGTLINVGTDGGAGTPNYEIADKDNLVSGGVVLVRKEIYSESKFGWSTKYPDSILDNLIKTTIYNKMPQELRDKMLDVTFYLWGSGDITRKIFALTYTMAGIGSTIIEGKALQLYTSNASRIKNFKGAAGLWWVSSRSNAEYSAIVQTDGTNNFLLPDVFAGVVPTFAIPADTAYDLAPNTDGSYNLIL